MSRIKQIELFQYDELSESAQAKARDWYREASPGDESYAESVLEDAKEALKVLGYRVDNIYYSGFSSQGSGACFTGFFYASDYDSKGTNGVQKLLLDRPTDKELARCAAKLERILLACPKLSASIEHVGFYHHEMSTRLDVDLGEEYPDEKADERQTLEDDFIEVSRDLMTWIYEALKADYEYQQSDEVVAENIRCNECEFTADGVLS